MAEQAGGATFLPLRRFWQSARGFWRGDTALLAWGLIAALAVTTVLQVVVQYRLNLWNREHAGEVVPDPTADRGPVAQKKNPSKATPTKSTSSPASRAGVTGRASRTSSTARPSATSSPRATATSPRSASPASPPPPSPPACRKPKTASKKR